MFRLPNKEIILVTTKEMSHYKMDSAVGFPPCHLIMAGNMELSFLSQGSLCLET
jgi:hypothetical protein